MVKFQKMQICLKTYQKFDPFNFYGYFYYFFYSLFITILIRQIRFLTHSFLKMVSLIHNHHEHIDNFHHFYICCLENYYKVLSYNISSQFYSLHPFELIKIKSNFDFLLSNILREKLSQVLIHLIQIVKNPNEQTILYQFSGFQIQNFSIKIFFLYFPKIYFFINFESICFV